MSRGQHAIFIGYRRDDSGGDAGRIFDRLEKQFGEGRVFKDVDSIPPGVKFRDYVATTIGQCRVFLILIGPTWVNAEDSNGQHRLDDPGDLVRIEIETALATRGVQVIPVLVAGAEMPSPDRLPDSLKAIADINAARMRRDPDFNVDMERLLRDLEVGERTGTVVVGPSRKADSSAKATSEARLAQVDLLIDSFFRPVRTRLQKDDAIWKRILGLRASPNSIEHRVAASIEKEILTNHDEIVSIIEKCRHLADDDDELSTVLNEYLEHVAVYKAIRAAGEAQTFPEDLGARWPKRFGEHVQKRLTSLLEERAKLKTS